MAFGAGDRARLWPRPVEDEAGQAGSAASGAGLGASQTEDGTGSAASGADLWASPAEDGTGQVDRAASEAGLAGRTGRAGRAGRTGPAGRPGGGAAGGENPESAAMEICLRLLTAAPRTHAQLADALGRRGIPQQAADAALGRLAAARLIDDGAFAQAWVETRHRSRGLAARALTAELRQRGVAEGDVRAAVAELGPEQEEAAARRLVDAKLDASRGKPLPVRVRRLTSLLARKGYPAGLAYRVVREALEHEGIDPAGTGLDAEAVLDAELGVDGLDGLDGVAGLDD